MATYAIGDIQGCYDELIALLDKIRFDQRKDQLWFVGDLVNRGPKSLQTLRFVKSLGDSAITVLGNHDLHLLALAEGNAKHKDENSLDDILAAPDRDDLLGWLRHRPLLHRDKALGFSMIHAGLPPLWDIKTAKKCARELEATLRGEGEISHHDFFLHMYGNKPDHWSKKLAGMERLRFITNCLTRLRYVDADGKLGLKQKFAPGTQEPGFIPWYEHPERQSRDERIVFGHWSTLGYRAEHNTWALDTGCLWGGQLTALQIDCHPPHPVQLNCRGQQDPGRYV